MDILALGFSLLVALLFGVLIGWWVARSGKKQLADQSLQLDAELRDAQTQLNAVRTEVQLQRDDYEAKLRTVQVDIAKRSADIAEERTSLSNSIGDYESRIRDLQSGLDARAAELENERARGQDTETIYTQKVQVLEENLTARLAELELERQRSRQLQAQLDETAVLPATAQTQTAEAAAVNPEIEQRSTSLDLAAETQDAAGEGSEEQEGAADGAENREPIDL